MTIYIYKGSLHLKKNNVKLTQITQKWPLKDLPGTVCLWSVPLYIILGDSGHFGSEKRIEISPKMASIACYWASKCSKFFPELPQNDSQIFPTVLYSCGQYYYLLFGGIQVIFR